MPKGLWERLRGARGIEILLALALLALLALALPRTGGNNAGATALETRLERILSGIEGAGNVRAMVTEDVDGRTSGAVIVADGLKDVSTYLKLQAAATTLLELDASRVEIIGGRFGGG